MNIIFQRLLNFANLSWHICVSFHKSIKQTKNISNCDIFHILSVKNFSITLSKFVKHLKKFFYHFCDNWEQNSSWMKKFNGTNYSKFRGIRFWETAMDSGHATTTPVEKSQFFRQNYFEQLTMKLENASIAYVRLGLRVNNAIFLSPDV